MVDDECVKPTKNTIICEIGQFPKLHERYRTDFPAGCIVLKYGEHKQVNKGFGIIHILAEHSADLRLYKLEESEQGVIEYVKLILTQGADIFSEFNDLRGNHRPMIIRSAFGTVVLEKQYFDNKVIYSVVSAFGRKIPKGTKIGTL